MFRNRVHSSPDELQSLNIDPDKGITGKKINSKSIAAIILCVLIAIVFLGHSESSPLRAKPVPSLVPTPPVPKTKTHYETFCEWETRQSRFNISGSLKEISSLRHCRKILSPHVQAKPVWYFMGDSTMYWVAVGAKQTFPYHGKVVKTHNARCHFYKYYGLEPATTWIPPNFSLGQGPIKFGLESPFCTDCQGCSNFKFAGDSGRYFESFAIEFAMDVEQQTTNASTTQETLTHYLVNQRVPINDTVCVVNAGFHDMAIEPLISTELYAHNVDVYVGLLEQACGQIVWVGLSAILDNVIHQQSNSLIKIWNNAVYEMLKRSHPEVFFFSVFNKSAASKHTDIIHLEKGPYYNVLGAFFVDLMRN